MSWLVGSWQFNSEARQVHLSNEWTLNNSYLKQTFQLTIPGKEELQGFQLIGWDPVAKSVHSWVFDSDGGFGEAHWSQQEESWIAMMVFIFADGRKGSSTNIYQKLDDKSYSFASKEREIEGEWLPDVGPITVIRKGRCPMRLLLFAVALATTGQVLADDKHHGGHEEIRAKGPSEPASHPNIPVREEHAVEHHAQYPLPTMSRSFPTQNKATEQKGPISREQFRQFVQARHPKEDSGQIQTRKNTFISKWKGSYSHNVNANHIRSYVHEHDYHRDWFNSNFFERHHFNPIYYHNGVNWWRVTGWNSIITWLPWGYGVPIYYAEGYPITLTPDEYSGFQQNELPDNSQEQVAGDWMPLGVYAVVADLTDSGNPSKYLQLALDKQGNISGSYYNEQTDQVHPVSGTVDQQSQLVAFRTDVPNSPTAYTGLYNLTQAQTAITVVFSSGETMQRYLIRLQE